MNHSETYFELRSLYHIWSAMKSRCKRDIKGYEDVNVCPRWKNSFDAFVDDMGYRPSKSHSLDRIDPFGDYCPENCRWATSSEQALNRRLTVKVTLDGVTKSAKEWCDEKGIKPSTLKRRMDRNGMSPQEALEADRYYLNGKRQRVLITAFGESHSYKEWSQITGIPYRTLMKRIKEKGWSPERALKTPFSEAKSQAAKKQRKRDNQ